MSKKEAAIDANGHMQLMWQMLEADMVPFELEAGDHDPENPQATYYGRWNTMLPIVQAGLLRISVDGNEYIVLNASRTVVERVIPVHHVTWKRVSGVTRAVEDPRWVTKSSSVPPTTKMDERRSKDRPFAGFAVDQMLQEAEAKEAAIRDKPFADVDRVLKEMGAQTTSVLKNEEKVNHPSHYGGDTTYEAIKVMLAWHGYDAVISFCLLTAEKYLSRLGKKAGQSIDVDLQKASWYLEYYYKLRHEMENSLDGGGKMKVYEFNFIKRGSGEAPGPADYLRMTALGQSEWHALKRIRETRSEDEWTLVSRYSLRSEQLKVRG